MLIISRALFDYFDILTLYDDHDIHHICTTVFINSNKVVRLFAPDFQSSELHHWSYITVQRACLVILQLFKIILRTAIYKIRALFCQRGKDGQESSILEQWYSHYFSVAHTVTGSR